MQVSEGMWWLALPLLAVVPMILLVLVAGMLCLVSLVLPEQRRRHVLDLLRLMICLGFVIARPGRARLLRPLEEPSERSVPDPELATPLVDGD